MVTENKSKDIKSMTVEILKAHSCLTANELKGFIYRTFGENLSPNSISGNLRALVSAGYVGKSLSPNNGKTAYWLTDYGKEHYSK